MLPFEDQLPFESLPFEEEDPLSKEALTRDNTVGRAIGENVKGAITAAGDLIGSIPGMVGGAPYALYEGITKGPAAGLQTMGEMTNALNPLREDFHYGPLPGVEALTPDRDAGSYHNIMKPFEMMSQGWGNIAALPFEMAGASPETVQAAGETGELAFGLAQAPMMAAGPLQGRRMVRQQEAAAKQHVQSLERGATEYDSWITDQAVNAEYAKQLRELDNVMIQYGKELQAPQLGLGGKVAKHADQVGKREKGEFSSQMRWDEEMYKQGNEYQEVRNQAHEAALEKGVDHLGQYGPTTKGTTLDHAPSPVRPHQVVQERAKRISEGEATKIYLKPPFQRTLEEKLQLQDYEGSLKGPRLTEVADDPAYMIPPFRPDHPMPYMMGVKDPGGNWHPKAQRTLMDAMDARHPQRLGGPEGAVYRGNQADATRGKIWYHFVERATRHYLQKYAGTVKDPLKDIEIPYEGGTARWEDVMDTVIAPREASKYIQQLGESPRTKAPDWLSPHIDRPETPIWDIDRNSQSFNQRTQLGSSMATEYLTSYLRHVKDYLDTHVRPEELHRYDLVRAVRETAQWDRELAKGMDKKIKDSMKDATIHKDYGDGFKWIKLDKPGQFLQESDMMGHSVRGYEPADMTPEWRQMVQQLGYETAGGHPNYGLGGWDAIKRGEAEIFSLRDPKGKSHVTIEVEPRSHPAKLSPEALEKQVAAGLDAEPIPSIIQIKGKQNRAPEEKYLKYVQDFVRSREWGDVGDLGHTGLVDLKLGIVSPMIRNAEFINKEAKDFYGNQRYITREQLEYFKAGGRDPVRAGKLKDLLDRDGNPIDFPYKEGGYAFRDFKKDLEAKGIKVSNAAAKAMYNASTLAEKPKAVEAHPSASAIKHSAKVPGLDRIQREYVDQRTYEEMLPDAQKHGDVGMVKKNITAKALPPRFMTDHPLWTWTNSKVHEFKNKSMENSLKRLHGKSRKQPDPGTYNHVWRQLTAKEREAVNEFGWKHNNEQAPVSGAELAKLSPKQRQAYQDRININKQVLADVNKMLESEGKPPIHELPNYWSPIILDDPFIVKFKDSTGETKKIAGFYTKPDMKGIQKVAKEHGFEAELAPERGVKGDLDFEQIEWVLRHLGKEMRDPAAKALAEGLRRQGFTRHGLKRKGVEGGAGSQRGRKGLRDYEEVSEKFIRRAYEWISNRELDKLHKKILDEKSLDDQPYAKAYALEMIDTARGGANATFEGFSKLVGDVVSGSIQIGTAGKLKLPNRFARDLLRYGNKVKTTLLLGFGNVTNIAANGLQAWTYAPPALMAAAAKAGQSTPKILLSSVPKAMFKASNELLKWDDSKDIQRLREIGALDATFKYDWSTYASDKDPRYSSTVAEHLTGISTLSWIESNAVRRPASLMFLNMLREIGYDKMAKSKDEIYYVAKEMTDKYMVSNRWYEKPHAFSRSGIVGTAISPLQSFTTTWLGMLREYGKLSAEGIVELNLAKQLPLGAFMAMNVLTAGLLGLIGIKEWDAIATRLNRWFGYNIPTGTEWIMSKWKSNKLRFGLLSDAVGVHIGATFNAPTLTGSFAPGLQAIGDAVNFVGTMGKEYGSMVGLNSPPTSQEKRDALKGVTPRFNWLDRATDALGMGSTGMNWGDIEKNYTPPGMPYQDLAGNAGAVTRDETDWKARQMGTYTTKEATDKTENFILKKAGDERSRRLSSSIEKMADIITMNMEDPNVMDKIEPLIQKLEKDEFTGKDIKNALRRELMSKMVESDVRMMGKGKSSRHAYIARLLEELR